MKEKSKPLNSVLEASALPERDVPDYIEVDHKAMKGKFMRKPALEDVPYLQARRCLRPASSLRCAQRIHKADREW
ncbi:MAG: hypothetical protein FJX54_18135 [Alphaproteobacteria bacterium]|nr:hypothetical protein [Alphaproteobacteria bacterium]